MAAWNSRHGIKRGRRERVPVLHHPRRRTVPRKQRRVQPLRRGHLRDGCDRQDPGRRHTEVDRNQRFVRWRFAWPVAGVVLTATAFGYSEPYANTNPIANESPGRATPSPGFDDFHAGDGLTPIVFPDGLKSIDLRVGTGAVARSGDDATVQYTGWLADGTMFDSSRVRNQAFDFTIGQGQVIIPAALAYGAQGQTDPNTGATVIPPNATLVFEIELVSVKPGASPSPSPK